MFLIAAPEDMSPPRADTNIKPFLISSKVGHARRQSGYRSFHLELVLSVAGRWFRHYLYCSISSTAIIGSERVSDLGWLSLRSPGQCKVALTCASKSPDPLTACRTEEELTKFMGDTNTCYSIQDLCTLIMDEFPAFNSIVRSHGRPVCFARPVRRFPISPQLARSEPQSS